MALSNDSPSRLLYRIQWRESVFQWLREKRQYSDFDLDSCLKKLERDPLLREAAIAAFWGAYLGNELPPVLNNPQHERIRNLLDYGPPHGLRSEGMRDLAFVKLHLTGLLAICLIRPDRPIAEYPSAVAILKKALAVYPLVKQPEMDMIIDDPDGWGNRYFYENLFVFSSVLVGGIAHTELSFWHTEKGNYEEAFWGITNGAWHICAATVRGKEPFIEEVKALPASNADIGATTGEAEDMTQCTVVFHPYLPHSGRPFDIQEVANIFEEVKRHSKDVKNWKHVQMCCEAIQYLGHCGLYDWLDDIRDANKEVYGANEYWGRAATFAEVQTQFTNLPIDVPTKDMIKRKETEERLKRDFLGELWEEMNGGTQKLLVNAEMQWEYGRPDNMVKEIRQMLECVLPSTFLFLEPAMRQEGDMHLPLTRMKSALLRNKLVRASIDGLKIDNRDKQWVKDELPKFLQKVIATRNYFEKEQHLIGGRSNKDMEMREKAISIHKELLGIACEGVLPRLMKIKRIAHREK